MQHIRVNMTGKDNIFGPFTDAGPQMQRIESPASGAFWAGLVGV